MSDIEIQIESGVAQITLNRPQSKNAITRSMAGQLVENLVKIGADGGVRAILLTGSGGAFCAGADVREMSAGGDRTHEEKRNGMGVFRRLAEEMYRMDKPIIAATDGVVYGAGFSLALFADIIIASESARFCMVFNRMGLLPDLGAMYTLPRIVGLQRAKEIMLSARELTAREALVLGLVLEVLPADEMQSYAHTVARSLASASPVAVSILKRTLQDSFQSSLANILEIEACGQPIAADSEFSRDAKTRFASKAPPRFQWPLRGR